MRSSVSVGLSEEIMLACASVRELSPMSKAGGTTRRTSSL
jgi:hypothetical protein